MKDPFIDISLPIIEERVRRKQLTNESLVESMYSFIYLDICWGTWLAVGLVTLDLGVVTSSPTLVVEIT